MMKDPGKRRLGIFGGSFNPVHFGHIGAAAAFSDKLALDEVIVLPSAAPFYKRTSNIGFGHRHAMCELAFAGMKNITVSDLEKTRPEGMYTRDALDIIQRRYGGAELFLLMGSDVFGTMPQWEGFREIIVRARPAVMQRAFSEEVRELREIPNTEVAFVDARIPPLSSSLVRAAVMRGDPVDHMVPAAVAEYIRDKRLYVKEENDSPVCCAENG